MLFQPQHHGLNAQNNDAQSASHLPSFGVPSTTVVDIPAAAAPTSNGRTPSLANLRISDDSSNRLQNDNVVAAKSLRRKSDDSLTSDDADGDNYEPHAPSRVWCCRNFCDLCPDLLKYLMHATLLVCLIIGSQLGAFWARKSLSVAETDAVASYGILATILLYALRCCSILAIPQVLFSILGHTCFNPFRERIQLRVNIDDAPRIIFRVVTRGNYPDLVQHNVERNLRTLHAAGVRNFFIEAVTDKPINLRPHRRVLETVVPADYRPFSGALFKARALQYCLEPTTCWAEDHDWLVHLDEETILTQYSINGILNFATENAHDFGQGVIVYGYEHVVNWIFTLADSFRVADDLGKLQFQLRVLKRPVFGWKGSFVVSRAGAERQVTFDHGPDGSVAEDTFFAFMGFQQGYRFGFVEGHMLEKSPFGFKDFLQQRKRWIQGLLLVAHSRKIGVRYKLLFFCSLYAWLLIPLSTVNLIVSTIWPIAPPWWLDCLNALLLVQSLYMYVFGAFKTCSLKRASFTHTFVYVMGALFTLPINIVVENVAAVWGVLGKKHRFYIVDKNFLSRAGVAAGFSTESLSPPPSIRNSASNINIDADCAKISPKLSPTRIATMPSNDESDAGIVSNSRRRRSLLDNDGEVLQTLISNREVAVDSDNDNLMGIGSEVALIRSSSDKGLVAHTSPEIVRGSTTPSEILLSAAGRAARNNSNNSMASNSSSSERMKKMHGS